MRVKSPYVEEKLLENFTGKLQYKVMAKVDLGGYISRIRELPATLFLAVSQTCLYRHGGTEWRARFVTESSGTQN